MPEGSRGSPQATPGYDSIAKSADVWIARVDGKATKFKLAPRSVEALIEDDSTGILWSPETGEVVEGDGRGRKLDRVKAMTVYWRVWAQYHPDAEVVEGD